MNFKSYTLAAAVLATLVQGMTYAQQQPAVADNRQDENVNLNRDVAAGTDDFRILRSGDKLEMNRYVTKVYHLQYANPYELLPYMRTIAALEKGNVNTAYNPQPDGTFKSWIQVNVPEFQLESIDAAIKAYDVPNFRSMTGFVVFSYRTKYRSASEVADFIRATALSPDGRIQGDNSTNTIYIQDSPSDFGRVLAHIEFFDIPSPQIDLGVEVIELTEIDQTSLGLDWDFWKTAVAGDARVDLSTENSKPTTGGTFNSQSRSFDGFLTVNAAAVAKFLNYLIDQGKAKTMAETNLTVTTGTVGTVASGIEVPTFEYTVNRDLGRAILVRKAGEVRGEGFALAVAPVIAMEGARMNVAFSLSSPVGIDKVGLPIYSDQDVQAELTLEQGQTYKLGGIRRSVNTVEDKGFPVLKDIPVLKYLFANESRIIRETDVFVFLTPTWTAPQLPAMDAMQSEAPVMAMKIENILKENPNLAMSAKDAAILQQYFDTQKSE